MKSMAFLFILSLAVAPAQQPVVSLDPGSRLIEEGRTTLEEKPLVEAKSWFTQQVERDRTNAELVFQLARVNSYLVEAYVINNDKNSARRALEDAIDFAQRALVLNDKSAEAHALLADLYGRKIQLGAFMGGPRFGPKVDAENKRAVALAPDNAQVNASLGRQYLFAPKMFGGDIQRAIESFRKATQLSPTLDENYVWLAIALRKSGDSSGADKALAEALRLNPRSAFARHAQIKP